MKILKIFLINVILTSYSCYALELKDLAPNNDVKVLKKDDPAPFDGLLLSNKKANEVKNELVERDKVKEINKSLEISLNLEKENFKLSEDKNKLLINRNDELSKQLQDSREMSDIKKILWFALGVVATGGAVYGASKLAK